MDDLNVLVVCPETAMETVLTNIRKWGEIEQKRLLKWQVHLHTTKVFDLPSALEKVNLDNVDHSILIPIGFQLNDIKTLLDQTSTKKLEVIIRPPRNTRLSLKQRQENEINEMPSSSLLSNNYFINVQDTLLALRKACLKRYFKKRVTIRPIRSEIDFEMYFSLRYKAWKEMDYLKPSHESEKTHWEIDYNDRSAMPLGAFDEKDNLVACARLVFPLGRECNHLRLLNEMITNTSDKKLHHNFKAPSCLSYPFDVLDSFDGFSDHFSKLVKQKVRVAEVSRVIVDKPFRGRGLSEVIVDSLINRAQKHGQLDRLFLACQKEHEPYYERSGFVTLEGVRSDHFVNLKAQSIAMQRNL